MFPTRKHLERLARFNAVEPLLAHARQRLVSPVRPIETPSGEIVLPQDEDAW